MTKTLILMRHGDAIEGLTSLGKRQVTEVAHEILSVHHYPNVMLHSPLPRAKQSAEVLGKVFREAGHIITDIRSNDDIAHDIILPTLANLSIFDDTVLVIGHMPGISAAVRKLAKFDYAPNYAEALMITCGIDRWSELPRINRTHAAHLSAAYPWLTSHP